MSNTAIRIQQQNFAADLYPNYDLSKIANFEAEIKLSRINAPIICKPHLIIPRSSGDLTKQVMANRVIKSPSTDTFHWLGIR